MKSILVGGLLLWVASVACADAAAGKVRAATACAVCHGPLGLSLQPNVPHLAGQPQFYLVEQLRNYRSGKRQHEVMSVIAKPLSDQEIEDVSQWYASLQVQVEEK
ncbi:MAG: cytochrome c [Burkholderiales bacterium]|nr:cytochrome c [Burkholderiales bacterium]